MTIRLPATVFRCHFCRVQVYSKHDSRAVMKPHAPNCPKRERHFRK